MANWQLRIQRYNPKGGDTRISGIRHIHADGFDAAASRANDIAAGMKDADPECEFRIVHLLSHDYRGTDCEGGIYAFETRDEMSARLAPKIAGQPG